MLKITTIKMDSNKITPNVKFVIGKNSLPYSNQDIEKSSQKDNISNIKPKKFYYHLPKVINKKNQLPSYFIFYPTSRCNLSCSHCFYHDSLNKKFNELSIEEINKFTKTMDPLLHLIITGGEPYLREDIDEIVKIFYENTKVPIISIPSNGFFYG